MATRRLPGANPQQRRPARTTAGSSAPSRNGGRSSSTGGGRWDRTASRPSDVYLRTAVSVDAQGWAQFGYVKMPEYRWGIFLAEPEAGRSIAFGDHRGHRPGRRCPGEHRGTLRRLIVTQGDTEPASVEQQRHLGSTCPSLYDLRNLFQVNVEEGRHLWAMVYLLHAYFGRDGREEAEAMLQRRSGDRDKPRILGAFNEQTPDWLSYFMFTYFTDRDGKYQLASLAESGFDPLSRTCRFMLTEEAHHMFVGETGVGRVVQRTCELMREHRTDDVRRHGAIDLPTMQKYINFHYSVSLDLFGSEVSTNAANFYTDGAQGALRGDEEERRPPAHGRHLPRDRRATATGSMSREEPALTALNERLRDDYIADCQRGVDRWNKVIAQPRHRRRAAAAPSGLPPRHRRLRRVQGLARRPGDQPGGVGRPP